MLKLNLRIAVTFAFCVFAAAIFWTARLNDTASFGQFALPRFLQGFGIAFFFLPLNQILLSGVPPSELASASGLSNFTRTMAGSFSTAISVWIWNRRTDYHHAVLSEHIRTSVDAWTQYRAQLSAHGISGIGASEYVNAIINGQASTLAVNDVFNFLGVVYLIILPLVWFAKPPFGARARQSGH